MNTVKKFCIHGKIDTKHNSTFISLVPKKDYVETVKDCGPINLLIN